VITLVALILAFFFHCHIFFFRWGGRWWVCHSLLHTTWSNRAEREHHGFVWITTCGGNQGKILW